MKLENVFKNIHAGIVEKDYDETRGSGKLNRSVYAIKASQVCACHIFSLLDQRKRSSLE